MVDAFFGGFCSEKDRMAALRFPSRIDAKVPKLMRFWLGFVPEKTNTPWSETERWL
jgi:hypothetical protein